MPTSPAPAHEQTLKNLLAAFNGESNASARYAAFAVKADEEGYLKVASLFRAASRAEQIHAANHSASYREIGCCQACGNHRSGHGKDHSGESEGGYRRRTL